MLKPGSLADIVSSEKTPTFHLGDKDKVGSRVDTMVSSRSLLLGVYTSNGLIRRLFLPTCYLIFCSPFIALCIWKFDLQNKYLPRDYTTPDIWPQLFVSIVCILLATRAISGRNNGFSKVQGKRRVQLLPYWIPGLKNWPSAVFGGQKWLESVA